MDFKAITYARSGNRIANVQFVAMEAEDGKYITIGDKGITGGGVGG